MMKIKIQPPFSIFTAMVLSPSCTALVKVLKLSSQPNFHAPVFIPALGCGVGGNRTLRAQTHDFGHLDAPRTKLVGHHASAVLGEFVVDLGAAAAVGKAQEHDGLSCILRTAYKT